MALAKAIEEHKQSDTACPFTILLTKLNAEDQKVLLEAISKGVPTTTLTMALRSEGYKIGEPSINLHRQGKCRCPKTTK